MTLKGIAPFLPSYQFPRIVSHASELAPMFPHSTLRNPLETSLKPERCGIITWKCTAPKEYVLSFPLGQTTRLRQDNFSIAREEGWKGDQWEPGRTIVVRNRSLSTSQSERNFKRVHRARKWVYSSNGVEREWQKPRKDAPLSNLQRSDGDPLRMHRLVARRFCDASLCFTGVKLFIIPGNVDYERPFLRQLFVFLPSFFPQTFVWFILVETLAIPAFPRKRVRPFVTALAWDFFQV